MARILYAWELGEGLGHLVQARTLAEPLARMGHELFFVLQNPLPARRVLGDLGPFFAAPLWPPLPSSGPIFSYPRMLAAVGFMDHEALDCLVRAWRHLFALVRPDLVLADHSPTALLALRGLGIPSAPVGSGFLVPPRAFPMPPFSPFRVERETLESVEQKVVTGLNAVLEGLDAPRLERCADLFGEKSVLLTYRELDHYADRDVDDAEYWGVPPAATGTAVTWPSARGDRRIFAYVKPFRAFDALVTALAATGDSVLIYVPGLPREQRAKHETPSLCFLDRPADVVQVARECDLTITHGGIGTIAYVLLAGKPLLLLPLQLEQQILSECVVRLGAGLSIVTPERAVLDEALARLLTTDGFANAARAFRGRYGSPTKENIETRLRDLVDSLLA